MIAEIDKQGRLVVKPGTETEAYALAEWFRANWIATEDAMRGERGHWRGSSVQLLAADARDRKPTGAA